MVLSNILLRTHFVKAELYGTAFTIDVDGDEYLVTAKHLLDETRSEVDLRMFRSAKWHDVRAKVIGHGRGEVDISVLKLPMRLTAADLVIEPSIADLQLGQDVYFLGFPYKMWGDVGNLMGGLPCPFAKKGVVSSMQFSDCHILHIDALNNEGFSGGPLFFYPAGKSRQLRVAGVVSKYRLEFESVLDGKGDATPMSVPYNTGFLVAYGAKHILDVIARQPRG